jgi:hypothetical protein
MPSLAAVVAAPLYRMLLYASTCVAWNSPLVQAIEASLKSASGADTVANTRSNYDAGTSEHLAETSAGLGRQWLICGVVEVSGDGVLAFESLDGLNGHGEYMSWGVLTKARSKGSSSEDDAQTRTNRSAYILLVNLLAYTIILKSNRLICQL